MRGQRRLRWALWLAAVLACGLVFAAYTQRSVVLALAYQLWTCF